MIVYLTYEEYPKGLFKSQIADTARIIEEVNGEKVLLVSFISIKQYFKFRREFKKFGVKSLVLPSFSLTPLFPLSVLFLFPILFFTNKVIARNTFACRLVVKLKKFFPKQKVVYDVRGLVVDEAREYNLFPDYVNANIEKWERDNLKKADKILVVTEQMIPNLIQMAQISSDKFLTIPCNLDFDTRLAPSFPEDSDSEMIKVCFSGGVGGWQSFNLLSRFIELVLDSRSDVKFTLLTRMNPEIEELIRKYGNNKIDCKWVSSEEVGSILMSCDYGLIIREKSITNSVARPTKYAEYLNHGLKIIATDSMAISDEIEKFSLGKVISTNFDLKAIVSLDLKKIDSEEKERISKIALETYSKHSQKNIQLYGSLFHYNL